jgi:hypothetical protein
MWSDSLHTLEEQARYDISLALVNLKSFMTTYPTARICCPSNCAPAAIFCLRTSGTSLGICCLSFAF